MSDGLLSLQKMQTVSWVLLGILTCGGAIASTMSFALSVFAGGIISIGSLWVSHRDVLRIVDSITAESSPEDRQAQAQQGQKGYLLKFWLRLVIVGIVLFLLIKSGIVNIFGLILGLSTVVLAITLIAVTMAGHYLFRGRR